MAWLTSKLVLAISAFASPIQVSAFLSRSSLIAYQATRSKGTNHDVKHLTCPKAMSSPSSLLSSSTRTTSEEIIPREILFGNPEYTSPLLSPDGNYLAFLAPSPGGVMNIFIRDLRENNGNNGVQNGNTPRKDRMITNEPTRAVRSLAWAYDSATILYMQDCDGDENFHLFAVDALPTDDNSWDDANIPPARDLTPGEKVKAQNIITNYRYPDEILVGTNKRDPKVFDMYRIFYKTGEMYLDTLNPGDVIGWKTEDESFQIRAATVRNSEDSSTTIRIRCSADLINDSEDDTDWKDVFHFPYGEEGGLISFCADGGKTGCLTSSLARETTALLKVNLETGETLEEIFANDKCNVGGVTLEKDTKEIRALSYNYARTVRIPFFNEIYKTKSTAISIIQFTFPSTFNLFLQERVFFDEELRKDYEFLNSKGPNPQAEVGVASRSHDESKWIVSYFQSNGPTSYVIYDKPNQIITPLFVSNPKLLKYKFAPMEDVRIRARDGLELVAYLTRAVTGGRSPLILLVHGGPWARDYWGFNARAQWFANRGYATLQVGCFRRKHWKHCKCSNFFTPPLTVHLNFFAYPNLSG